MGYCNVTEIKCQNKNIMDTGNLNIPLFSFTPLTVLWDVCTMNLSKK